MVVCIIALVAFAVLGIFSARYRKLAKEAADCTFRKLTLRPCDTGLDIRLKAHVTSKLINHPRTARLVHKNFDAFMTLMFIIMVVSMIFTGYYGIKGVYNYAAFGNCNGPDSSDFCIFKAALTEHPSRVGALFCNATDCTCITPTVNCTVTGKDYTPCDGTTCSCPE
ncbi:MAG: hypothetical protein V1839_01775 [archaeon]